MMPCNSLCGATPVSKEVLMREMKVGDLVMLSSSGKKLKRTQWVATGDMGVIKSLKVSYWTSYEVHWIHSKFGEQTWDWNAQRWFDRRDLKYVR